MSLAIICTHFNPAGFHTPRRNLMRFIRQAEMWETPVFIGELAYDATPYFLPSMDNVFHFRTDSTNAFWHKENLLNLIVERLPNKFTAVAWIDPDIAFLNAEWPSHAVQALENRVCVQLFTEALWTNEDGVCYRNMPGCVAAKRLQIGVTHPGFAWAAKRSLWNDIGGLYELAVLGGADALFAAACLGEQIPEWLNYGHSKQWMHAARDWANQNGGPCSIEGRVVHEWHGNQANRRYLSRHRLIESADIPALFVSRPDGLLEFTSHSPVELRQGFRQYFRDRYEDGTPEKPLG